jgi:hypothetical protein
MGKNVPKLDSYTSFKIDKSITYAAMRVKKKKLPSKPDEIDTLNMANQA